MTPLQRLQREMEDIYREQAAVKKKLHGARRGKRKRLRKQEGLLRQQMAEQFCTLLDLQRSEQNA